jgi:hypothetical protein
MEEKMRNFKRIHQRSSFLTKLVLLFAVINFAIPAPAIAGSTGLRSTPQNITGDGDVIIVEEPVLTPDYGPTCQTAWYRYTNNRGHHAYLTLNTNDPDQSYNSGRWTPDLPRAGRWRVEAFIPNHAPFHWPCTGDYIDWDTSDARYTIHYNGGSKTVSGDQAPYFDGWLNLGTHDFAAGNSGYVELSDLNDEVNISYFISFSAMRFTWVGEPNNNRVIEEVPNIHPAYGGGMCDSAWYRYTNDRGHPAYLTVNTNDPNQSTNWADWQPDLPYAGNYKVEAYIPVHDPVNWQCPSMYLDWDTSDAHYTIYHAEGQDTVRRDQAPLYSEWLDLGTYRFNAGSEGRVKLTDLNTETNWSRTVSFSALRFTLQDGDPADVKTLILVNREQLVSLYGSTEADRIMNKLGQLANHRSVQGAVIQLEDHADVATAYDAWEKHLTDFTYANDVGDAIHDLIDQQVVAHPEIRYIVIVGDDRIIPFYRVHDRTGSSRIHPESHYSRVNDHTTVGAALKSDMILTDNFYADKDRQSWRGFHAYAPDLATGRLIETPDEIVSQIDAFLTSDGSMPTNAAVVGGRTAREMRDIWRDDGLSVNESLISNRWKRDDFIEEILSRHHDMVAVDCHSNHHEFASTSSRQRVSSSDVNASKGDHTQTLFFISSCHSGLNVPPENSTEDFDLVQAFVNERAIYIGNTGYSFGARFDSIAWSDRLMVDYADFVYRRGLSVGQALAAAKRFYCSSEGRFDALDEKTVLITTLYGLPMYEFRTNSTMASTAQASQPYTLTAQSISIADEGLTRNSVSYEFPELAATTSEDGVIYTLTDEVQIDDGKPIQPRVPVDITFVKTTAHGAVFRGGSYRDITSFDPVVDLAVTEESEHTEPNFDAPGWYPVTPFTLNQIATEETLVQILGQFHPKRSVERLYEQLQFDVYYHTSSSDWTAPSVSAVSSTLGDGEVTVSVGATDDGAIHTVVLAYTDGNGRWESIDLSEENGLWSGSFPATSSTEFFIQAVDASGNVTVAANEGRYYRPHEDPSTVYLPLVIHK